MKTVSSRSIGVSLAAVACALAAGGCPQTIEVSQSDLLPDAAVAPYTAEPACRQEPHEIAKVDHIDGDLLARLLRADHGAVLLRSEPAKAGSPLKLSIVPIAHDGLPSKAVESTETGEPGPVIGLDAVMAAGNVVVALTRPEGRVDVVTLGLDGQTKAPVATLTGTSGGRAQVIWFRGAPLVVVGGSLMRPDGSPFELTAGATEAPSSGDGGPAGDGGPVADAGPAPATDGGTAHPVALPSGIKTIVAAGDTLGWLRVDDRGVWLEHFLEDQGTILSTEVAPPGHDDVRLIWAGDRYIVGDSQGADVGRYIIAHPRARSQRHLKRLELGGRMVLPRPPTGVAWTAWDNTGARHLGLAQLIAPRELRFLNVALGGMALDAAIHISRQRDVVAADVVWDGHGYVMAWAEKLDRSSDQLLVTRFSCPDDN